MNAHRIFNEIRCLQISGQKIIPILSNSGPARQLFILIWSQLGVKTIEKSKNSIQLVRLGLVIIILGLSFVIIQDLSKMSYLLIHSSNL